MGFSHNPNIVTDGLVLSFDPADENCITSGSTTANDLSVSSNSGTLNDGKIGKDAAGSATAAVSASGAFHLDGTDYITVADSDDFTFGTAPFAVEMWLKFTDTTPNDDPWHCAWQQSSAENARTGLMLFYNNGGTHEWRCENSFSGVSSGGCYPAIITLTNFITLHKWHLVTVTRQAETSFKQAIDGVVLQHTTASNGHNSSLTTRGVAWNTTWPNIGGTLLIGNYRTADHHEFQGEIGPVRVYNGRALSDDELRQNFESQRTRFGV